MAILSISIPTYNRVEQLKELVESILFIDTPDIEVVVTLKVFTTNYSSIFYKQ